MGDMSSLLLLDLNKHVLAPAIELVSLKREHTECEECKANSFTNFMCVFSTTHFIVLYTIYLIPGVPCLSTSGPTKITIIYLS